MAASASPTKRGWRDWSVPVTFAVIVLVTACLYWAQTVLIPVALTILLTFVLSPLVSLLQRVGLGRTSAVILVVICAGLVLAALAWLITAQVNGLANDLPAYRENIERKLADLRALSKDGPWEKFTATLNDANSEVQNTEPASGGAMPVSPLPVVVQNEEKTSPFKDLLAAASTMLEPLAMAGLVVILVIYTLLRREDLRNRVIMLLGPGHLTVTTKALEDAGQRISRYLLMQLIVNGTFGIVIGVGLFFIGVPYPILWGFMAAVLRYIPYLGAWLAALLPILVSLLVFEQWTEPLLVIGLFIVSELGSNLIMEPVLYGQSIGVSEAPLLVAVAFWTWIWGPLGLVLATPLTVCLVVLGKYVPQLAIFDVLLGDEPVLPRNLRFYQRLLAGDNREAIGIAAEQLESASLADVCNCLVIPSLSCAKCDLANDRLRDDEAQAIFAHTRELVEELGRKARAGTETADAPPSPVRSPVLLCPGHDAADEVAAAMLRQLLGHHQYEFDSATSETLASELLDLVERKRPALVCILSVPPGGLAHTRYLCLKLRTRFPELTIVVGRWGLCDHLETERDTLLAAGADTVGMTPQETENQVRRLATNPQGTERLNRGRKTQARTPQHGGDLGIQGTRTR